MNVKNIHPAIALGLCGLLTAFVNYLVLISDTEFLTNWLGVIFGLVIAGYLTFAKDLSIGRAAVIVIGFGLSWLAAFWGAFYLMSEVDILYNNISATGVIAGAIGAALVVAGFCVAYRSFLRPMPILRTIGIGAVAGALLVLIEDIPLILFVVWQGLVGASLGWDKAVFETAEPED